MKRDRERPEGDLHLGHRSRTWTTGSQSGPVLTLGGTEMPPMTGDNTLRCRCGLELRAHTDRALDELRTRHDDDVCLVVHRPDHWSIKTMLRQRERPQWRGHEVDDRRPELDEEPGEVPDPVEA